MTNKRQTNCREQTCKVESHKEKMLELIILFLEEKQPQPRANKTKTPQNVFFVIVERKFKTAMVVVGKD